MTLDLKAVEALEALRREAKSWESCQNYDRELHDAAPELLALAKAGLQATEAIKKLADYIDMGHISPGLSGDIWRYIQPFYDEHIRPVHGPHQSGGV